MKISVSETIELQSTLTQVEVFFERRCGLRRHTFGKAGRSVGNDSKQLRSCERRMRTLEPTRGGHGLLGGRWSFDPSRTDPVRVKIVGTEGYVERLGLHFSLCSLSRKNAVAVQHKTQRSRRRSLSLVVDGKCLIEGGFGRRRACEESLPIVLRVDDLHLQQIRVRPEIQEILFVQQDDRLLGF